MNVRYVLRTINEILEELDSAVPPPLDIESVAAGVTGDDVVMCQQHIVCAMGHVQSAIFHLNGAAEALGMTFEMTEDPDSYADIEEDQEEEEEEEEDDEEEEEDDYDA